MEVRRQPRRRRFRSSVQPIEPGNIDIYNRPRVQNRDGSISTVRSMSVNVDGREYLIPTVSDDGRVMTDEEATRQFMQTGRHLGAFRTPDEATRYAQGLHSQQEQLYRQQPRFRSPDDALRAIGATITSGARSPVENARVGGAERSYHLTTLGGNARDIRLAPGMTKAKIRQAIEAAGKRVVELLGPGDPGHDDHYHVAWR